jgi:arylsulfatase A-like enzyme
LVLDTVRASSLSLYGYPRETSPELRRLSQRGVLFSRAYAHSSWTLPSHASLFTGCYPHEVGGTFQTPINPSRRTIAEVFSHAGYLTAGFVGNTTYCSFESGLDRGFEHYEDYSLSVGETIRTSVLANYVAELPQVARWRHFQILGRKSAASISRRFLSWLEDHPGRPFFAFLNFIDAHAPYLPPAPFDQRFGAVETRPNPRHLFSWNWTREQMMAEQDAYDGAVAYLDSEVGALVSALEERNLLRQTLIVIVSDHGELFGEHGLMDHANSLYAPLLHVPLLVMWPGRIPSGIVVTQPVGLRHLSATMVDLAGVGSDGLRGDSLAPLWRSDNAAQQRTEEPLLASLEKGIRVDARWRNARGGLHSLISGNLHYIRNEDGSEELFDLIHDPGEQYNRATDSDAMPDLRQTLQRLLRTGSGA